MPRCSRCHDTPVKKDGRSAASHHAYQRAVREAAPEAVHVVAGLHRAPGHPTTQTIERSHVPVKDRVRLMQGLQSIVTGQQVVEGMTVAQAIRRGDVAVEGEGWLSGGSLNQRARHVVATFQWLAGERRLAS